MLEETTGGISVPIAADSLATLRREHLLTVAAALAEIEAGRAPTDVALHRHFRSRRSGRRDRACVREMAYGVLRSWHSLRAALGPQASPLQLASAWLLANAIDPPALREVDPERLRADLDAGTPSVAQAHNLPATWWAALEAQHGAAGASALARALNRPAPVDLRVNTLRATRDAARERLAEEDIQAEPIDACPTALRLLAPAAVTRSRAFREGLVEPQDVGSQRLAEFTSARAGERVLDLCAGAGGKSLAMAAMMRDDGILHATDAIESRLAKLGERAARAGLSLLTRLPAQASRWPDHARDYDCVLVDAPCSGSGALRRHPEIAVRGADLEAHANRQQALLERAATLVAPGGRVVYATCSVLRTENEAVIEAFLARSPGWSLSATLTLQPPRDDGDGYYAVRLVAGG